MTKYKTSQEWLHYSSLLIEAQPETTRVTTRYHIADPNRKAKERQARQAAKDGSASQAPAPATTPKPPRGHLVLRTYDPVSGVTLHYRTSKAAEVAHLVQMLGTLGRKMAALPTKAIAEDVTMPDAPVASGSGSGTQTPVPAAVATGGGGKGKKKKGRK